MFSISISEPLVISSEWIPFQEIYPHEEVVEERHEALQKYLESLIPYAILPSIIICNDSNVIIDGHHRYFSLIELGFKMIPITKINYNDNSVVTDLVNPIPKKTIIDAALSKNLLGPKSLICGEA